MSLSPRPLRALLVDDEMSIRKVVARMLIRRFHVEVVECENGMQALEALTSDRYSLMLLDLEMPVIDGVQVLQAVRDTPSLSHLPVIVMTGCDEDETVRRVVNFGVTGYIVKPILPGELHDRLGAFLAEVRAQELPAPRSGGGGFHPLELSPDTRVVIADGSAEFRQFFTKTVGDLCTVEEIDSGLAAMKRCQERHPPYAIFIGSDLGVMKGEMLARNLQDSQIRIIGIQPPRLGLRPKKASPHEAMIVRSFVPEVFTEGFNALLMRQGALSNLRATIPDINLLGIAAAEETISATLRQPLVLRPAQARAAATRSWAASLVLEVGADAMPLSLHLSTPERCLPRLVERFAALGLDTPPDSERVLCPLVERISELLTRELQGRGLDVAEARPVQVSAVTRKGQAESHVGAEVILAFDVQRAGISFRLEIAAGDDAATSSDVSRSHASRSREHASHE